MSGDNYTPTVSLEELRKKNEQSKEGRKDESSNTTPTTTEPR